ncbi:MAG: hypothetical protein AB8B72_12970 [Crocinitomicaceae bacterium]
MTFKILIYLSVTLFACMGCKTDKEKLNTLINSSELYIQQNTYGGLFGYSEILHHIYISENELVLVVNEGMESKQRVIITPNKKSQLDLFIRSSFISNEPEKKMSNSCMGLDQEYVISSGFTKLTFRPDYKCDSIFNEIVYN